LGHAFQVLPGEISHFQALSTAMAATIGMGNIAGVAGLSPAEVTKAKSL
jgi:Na+/alanine symporter